MMCRVMVLVFLMSASSLFGQPAKKKDRRKADPVGRIFERDKLRKKFRRADVFELVKVSNKITFQRFCEFYEGTGYSSETARERFGNKNWLNKDGWIEIHAPTKIAPKTSGVDGSIILPVGDEIVDTGQGAGTFTVLITPYIESGEDPTERFYFATTDPSLTPNSDPGPFKNNYYDELRDGVYRINYWYGGDLGGEVDVVEGKKLKADLAPRRLIVWEGKRKYNENLELGPWLEFTTNVKFKIANVPYFEHDSGF